ncbi:MAG TPA: trimethylamine methyltransferase family protein [Candidatus Brocadiia bacterium]|nr:trimethylamine methyltransferase family protein [Candidatus Brocadiia bacterium]
MLGCGLKVLSPDDAARIHDAALRTLERRGVCVGDARFRADMLRRGAAPGLRGDEMLLPGELVAECLATVNRRPFLKRLDGRRLELHSDNRHYGSLVTDPIIIAYPGTLRKATLGDIALHARLADSLPLVDNIHLMDDTIPGIDAGVSVLKALEALVSNTTCSYHCAPGTLRDTEHWIDIAEIMAGGDLKENPILAAYVPVVSPLMLTEFNLTQLRIFLERGVVCNVGPCAIAGATAPYTVAGLIVQSWAEYLAMLVASQVIMPGSAAIGGGGGAHEMNMATMDSLYSGPVKYLASAAMNELCEAHDLPTMTGNFSCLCSGFGVQNGLETMMGMFATFFSRCNLAHGMGSMANACGMSAAQIVIHHDVIEMLERFRQGVDAGDEKLALRSIFEAGPGGNFLEDGMTLEYLRSKEHFYASCYELCAGGRDAKTMEQRAHEKAEDLIASHTPRPPEERVEEVRRYVERELPFSGNS